MIEFALLGVICASNGLAVFRDNVSTYHLKIGDSIEGLTIETIEPRRVLLSRAGEKRYLYTGDIFSEDPMLTVVKGIAQEGSTIRITEQLKRFIEKDGLLTILMQAGAELVYALGAPMGFQLFDIEPGSVYELIGLKNGDIIAEIDGVALSSPFVAIRSLMRVRELPEFSFKIIRGGVNLERRIIVH